MEQILLQEHYFEKIKIEAMELTEFHDKNGDMIRNAYRKDQQILDIKNALDKGIKEMKGVALGLCKWKDKHLWYEGKMWIQEDEGLRTTIISRCQDNPLAGHGGIAKTTELITRQYYWPKMHETIKRYIKNCETCQRSKAVRHAPYGLL